VDLTRAAAYRLEASPDGNDLTLVFDEPVNDPIAALKTPNAPVLRQAPPVGIEPAAVRPAIQPARVPAGPQQSAPQAQAAPAAQQTQTQSAAAQARYTGNPVSLDFQGADLRAVLRTFSEISGLNLVPLTSRCATSHGTRRSTSSCARTNWATSSTAPSCASRH
jgi:hypothetical protein